MLRSKIHWSDMQCRQLSVWSVHFNFNALSSQNYFFLREGDVHNTYGNSGGMGAFLRSKIGNSWTRGLTWIKLPPWWGMDTLLNYTIDTSTTNTGLTVDQQLIDISINTLSTLDWQLVDSWLSVDEHIYWHSMWKLDSQPTIHWDINRVLTI